MTLINIMMPDGQPHGVDNGALLWLRDVLPGEAPNGAKTALRFKDSPAFSLQDVATLKANLARPTECVFATFTLPSGALMVDVNALQITDVIAPNGGVSANARSVVKFGLRGFYAVHESVADARAIWMNALQQAAA